MDYLIKFPNQNGVYCHFWEDECVVYHEPSAKTHLIDGLGTEIFKVLSIKVTTRSQLLRHLKNAFELPQDFHLETFLDNLVSEYQTLGLLEVRDN